jgi:hypothetical protein
MPRDLTTTPRSTVPTSTNTEFPLLPKSKTTSNNKMKKSSSSDEDFLCGGLCQESNFLLGNNGNQIDNPENSEEVSGYKLENTYDKTGCIALANTNECAVNVVKNNEKKLCNKGKILQSLSEFLHEI